MSYNFKEIESKWQHYWQIKNIFSSNEDDSKTKFYVLDMFPYPSGSGLHVGHPLGYIASDIYSRFKRLKGYNVLHPMGYDSFGLPAEQYAIQTGQHPEITTKNNILRYRKQLNKMGFSFDWKRELKTSDKNYYKWTQWIFKQFFNSWYCKKDNKAKPIKLLIQIFEKEGNLDIKAHSNKVPKFSNDNWIAMTKNEKEKILLCYRLAYMDETLVNWCPELGTVLANDEVKDGFSERGGYPVIQKKMKQWFLRISAYSQRLLDDIKELDWTHSIKEQQINWIGKSKGALVKFKVRKKNDKNENYIIEVFTTRPDTIFGVTYLTLAPDHKLISKITSKNYHERVLNYVVKTNKKSERERLSDVKEVTGEFTGTYAIHPITKKEIPIWISEYVISSYGTGAVMAVPAHDLRDFKFAKKFNLPLIKVIISKDNTNEIYSGKEGKVINSDFLNNLSVTEANNKVIKFLEKNNIGLMKIQYRLRDAIFSRQRYWGEPFPIYFESGIPKILDDDKLPLELPSIEKYLPTKEGDPPLARSKNWEYKNNMPFEKNTMPGWAGSSWYFLRFMDPKNNKEFVSKNKLNYWGNVDLYVGGSEHATGHLLYSRFFTKFLFDTGHIDIKEPFKKLLNQGMILGKSNFVYRIKDSNTFVSHGLIDKYEVIRIHVDINLVKNCVLNIKQFREWRLEFKESEFILENGNYFCGVDTEKMSKSKYNVVNPDEIIDNYGADTLRIHEMFLGPIEQYKPWNTNGINGVHNFLKKIWKLFHDDHGELRFNSIKPSSEILKVLNKTIKKVEEDIESFSFNTSISSLMVLVNLLTNSKCYSKKILEKLVLILSPFAPHICEELWSKLGYNQSIIYQKYPSVNTKILEEKSYLYPVSFNGKMRFKLELSLDQDKIEIEKILLKHDKVKHYVQNKKIMKIIFVPKKIINIVF